MTFREMAFDSGINNKNNYSGASDWEFYQKNPKFINLFMKNIGPKNYSVYKTKTKYFLVKDLKYQGIIEISKVNDEAYIASSHKLPEVKGFYSIMFPILLHDFKKIHSGDSLSTQAIKSYTKLSKTKLFKVGVLTPTGIKDFNKKLLLKGSNTVIIYEGTKFIVEFYKDYHKKINFTDILPSLHRKMFLENNPELERYLYSDLLENLD